MARVVIVTGADGGIGRAVVARLRANGHTVVATDLRAPPDGVTLDVQSPEAWHDLVEAALQDHGRVDVLINLAGVARAGDFARCDPADIDWHFDTNVKGAALGARTVLPHMLERNEGHIVNVGSLAAVAPVPGIVLYSATKFALRGLSIALSTELRGTGVDVSVVHPDLVDTPMIEAQRHQAEAATSFSGGRTLTADEVAVLITGTVLERRPLELCVPRHRGWLCKVVGTFPRVGQALAPAMRRRGLKRQARERRAGGT